MLANKMRAHNVISERSVGSRLTINLLAIFGCSTQIRLPVAICLGRGSSSTVGILPTNGIYIVTATEQTAKQGDSLCRSAHFGARFRTGDSWGWASGICDLWDWYSMRDQETSQTEVLLLQSLHFFSGHLRAWK